MHPSDHLESLLFLADYSANHYCCDSVCRLNSDIAGSRYRTSTAGGTEYDHARDPATCGHTHRERFTGPQAAGARTRRVYKSYQVWYTKSTSVSGRSAECAAFISEFYILQMGEIVMLLRLTGMGGVDWG